jgi:hypothetical protein
LTPGLPLLSPQKIISHKETGMEEKHERNGRKKCCKKLSYMHDQFQILY